MRVLLLNKFLHTKPQVINMNINYYYLYYTAFKNRDNENNENDYSYFHDLITPDHYIGIKPRETILR